MHYILAQGTLDEHMWELINAKHQAQRAVFDKATADLGPQFKTVKDMLAEAAGANVQLQIAKAICESPVVEKPRTVVPEVPVKDLVQAAVAARPVDAVKIPYPKTLTQQAF